MSALLPAVLALALAVAGGGALGQERGGRGERWPQRMDPQERERMREDVRDAYRERSRGERSERPRQMTPAERDKLRRDIESANRELRRK